MNKLQSLVQSRRFWAAVIGLVVIFLEEQIGLSTEQAQTIAALIAVWIGADSVAKTGGTSTTTMHDDGAGKIETTTVSKS